MERQYEDEIEIDLQELFFVLWGEIKIILISALLMAMTVFVFNKFVTTPEYASTSKLYILSKSTSLTSVADLQIGTNLTKDYMVVIKGRSVVEGVIDKLDLDETYASLSNRVEVSNPDNTRILNITITHEDPELARAIADEFAVVSSAFISEKMDQEPPNIIENAIVPENPIGPKTMRNTALGFIAGFVLMCGVIVVIHIMDDTIKDADEVEKYLGLNTLASIPVSTSVTRSVKEKVKNKKKNMKDAKRVVKNRARKQKSEVKK